MKISSPAFSQNSSIPVRYTCDGEDISPPLSLQEVPAAAKTLALIVDDPDAPAGTWVHWLVWNIDPQTTTIPEGKLPEGAREGVNDYRRTSYGGPCPPSGTHRYFFKLYALNTKLDLDRNAKRKMLEAAIKDHVIASAELVGLY